jgi:succinoglycan biosynthesis protein ExoA
MLSLDPRVAVVMGTLNEERHIDRSIDAIARQTISPAVVVVDNGSRDTTVDRLLSHAERDPRFFIHADGTRRSLPAAMNLGISMTRQPFVAKIDGRTFVEPDFLERALEVFEREGDDVACVGGRLEQFGETPFGQALAYARMSHFGVGGSGFSTTVQYGDVDSVVCGVYRRSALEKVGGFDPRLQFGEDEELNWRLRQAGYRIILNRQAKIRYVARPTWQAAFQQYRNYGRARTRVVRKHPSFIRLRHVVPATALLLESALVGASFVSPRARKAAAGLFLLYAAGALTAAALSCRSDRRAIPTTTLAFTALHLGYGVGVLEGLVA